MISHVGNMSSVHPGPSVRTEIGLPSFKDAKGGSMMWQPMSPRRAGAEVEDSPPHGAAHRRP